jgi:hypothetical protein
MACSSCALKATCRCTRPSWRRAASCRARRARRQRAGATGWMWRRQALDRPSSYSVAPGDASRSRILSWGALAGVVALAVGGLVLVFPKSDLMTLLRSDLDAKGRDRGNRDLSIAYLRNIIRTEPDDMSLRLLLAEKLLSGGDLAGARLVLDEAQPLARSSAQAQADWDAWDLNWWQAKLREAQSRNRDSETVQPQPSWSSACSSAWPASATPAQVFAAIQSAQALQAALGSRAGAAAALAQARAIPGPVAAAPAHDAGAGMADLSRGASLALAEGQFQTSADLYFAARRKTAQRDARERCCARACARCWPVASHWPHGKPQCAKPAPAPGRRTALVAGRAGAGRSPAARGRSPPAQRGARERRRGGAGQGPAHRAAAAGLGHLWRGGRPERGAGGGRRSAHLQPQDVVWLERKAQASEWAGLAPQALAAWLELLKRNASDKALANVFRLSPMLYDDDALLAGGWRCRRSGRLSLDEARQGGGGVRAPGLGGRRADLCAPAARRAARRRRGPARTLAGPGSRLLERAGRPTEALAVLERMRTPACRATTPCAWRRSTCAWATCRWRCARCRQPGCRRAANLTHAYWDLRADLAYETGERALALDALDRLIAQGKPQAYQAERAIRIRLDADRDDEALALAARLYPRFAVGQHRLCLAGRHRRTEKPGGPAHAAGRADARAPPAAGTVGAVSGAARGPVHAPGRHGAGAGRLHPRSGPAARQRTAARGVLVAADRPAGRAHAARRAGHAGTAARSNLAYAEVLAAGWQLLDEPRMALALMQPMARERSATFCGS